MVIKIKRPLITCFLVLVLTQNVSCSSGRKDSTPLFGFSSDAGVNKELTKKKRFPRDNPGALTYNRAKLPQNRKPIRTNPRTVIPQYEELPGPINSAIQEAAPNLPMLEGPMLDNMQTPLPMQRPNTPLQQVPFGPGMQEPQIQAPTDDLFGFAPPEQMMPLAPQPNVPLPTFRENTAPAIPSQPQPMPVPNTMQGNMPPAQEPEVPIFDPQQFVPAPSVDTTSPWTPEPSQMLNEGALPPPPQSYFSQQPLDQYWQPSIQQQAPQPFVPQEPFNNQWEPPVMMPAPGFNNFSPAPIESSPSMQQPMIPMQQQPMAPQLPIAPQQQVPSPAYPPGAITNPDQIQQWIQQPEQFSHEAPYNAPDQDLPYWQPPNDAVNTNPSWQPPVIQPNTQQSIPPLPLPGYGNEPRVAPPADYIQPYYQEDQWQPQAPIPLQPMYPGQGSLQSDTYTLAMSDSSFPDLRSVPPTPPGLKEEAQKASDEIKELQEQQKDIEKLRNDIHDITPNDSVESSEHTSENIS